MRVNVEWVYKIKKGFNKILLIKLVKQWSRLRFLVRGNSRSKGFEV